ncbi:DNA topoisomerase IV subunit B [Pollutimonas harenae]|uniref:DNA topoisomerase 4 subunit B n=1 Tax=Pollutimonas harenae TaxID=657015 RepID=A0A853H0A0_9BURK|nr:DNA topoisomerase IV subunit B [Pollutimonas harenae]NYT85762.1 type IIA DNA topoisomerase subunit B [Pollutimonas harenae]TEA70827.1 type IIA DNA topoisomerase subunit B [Pollutimonas harenae]
MAIPRYDEGSIRVLKGLEPVKQRPGMYTRTDNPLHIVQEVIDNAADEALAGFCTTIKVTLHTDGSVSVEDNGRGIPVGLHPEEKAPVVELVFTRLHAGGKFDKKSAGAYAFSGGLHGVGVSVTNALSTRLEVLVWRDGATHQLIFADAAVHTPLQELEPVSRKKTGTRIRVWPDPKYFDTATLPIAELAHALRSKAVLLSGVKVTLTIEKTGEMREWQYQEGLRGYLEEALGDTEKIIPLLEGKQYAADDDESYAEGEGAQWVIAWTLEGQVVRESYVNLIATTAGGTHEAGLRDGLFNAVKSFAELHSLIPKGVKLLAEDVFARASFVLSAKVLDPQFQGQIKEKLNSRDAVRLVGGFVKNALDLWLNANVEYGKKLADAAIRQAQARARSAKKVEKRKSSGVAVLPGKLTDCESDDVSRTELFLVEGDSAGGSAKMGRSKEFQAILPLRGKVLNSWEVDRDRLFANNEIHDIAVAIGVDPHGPNDTPDLSGLRYGHICILSDADVDGSHIQVLLLTLFFRHFPKLIDAGHVYIARPPLFRVDVPAAGKRPARKVYCLDQAELDIVQDKLRKEGVREGSWSISRFKGLGEMSAEQLWDTTMNPDTRRLMPVTCGELGTSGTTAMFDMLMGKGESAQRRVWLEEKGNLAEIDV